MSFVLVTVKEYARLFRKHQQTIYRRIRTGQFTKFHVERDGRNILIRVPASLIDPADPLISSK